MKEAMSYCYYGNPHCNYERPHNICEREEEVRIQDMAPRVLNVVLDPWFHKFGHWPQQDFATGNNVCLRCNGVLYTQSQIEDDKFKQIAAQTTLCEGKDPRDCS